MATRVKAKANAEGNPEHAAICLRRAAEALAKDAYRYLGKVQGGGRSNGLTCSLQLFINNNSEYFWGAAWPQPA